MADFATKTGTGGTVVPNTYDNTPALTDRVPLTGKKEAAIQDILDSIDDLSGSVALASVAGVTAAGAVNKRTLANLTTDLLATTGVSAEIGTAVIAAAATTAPTTGDLLLGSSAGAPRKWTAAQVAAHIGNSVSIRDYGAVTDGSTDDSAAIIAAQNALNTRGGGTLLFPPGITQISSPIPMMPGITYKGEGKSTIDHVIRPGSMIRSSASNIFENSSSLIAGVNFQNLFLHSITGGGHIFDWSASGIVAKINMFHCVFIQENANKAVINGTSVGGVFSIWLKDFDYQYSPLNTIPAMYFKSTAINSIVLDTFWSTCAPESTNGTYSIWIENTNPATTGFNCAVKNGVFELSAGGAVNFLSLSTSEIENCGVYDLTVTPNNPLFNIDTDVGGASFGIGLKQVMSRVGTSAKPDVRINCSVAGQSNFKIDQCNLLYLNGVSANNGPKTLVSASSIANAEAINFLSLGTSPTADLEFVSTHASGKTFRLWNGYSGANNGHLVWTVNGTYAGAINPNGLFYWGGVSAATPALYIEGNGSVTTTGKFYPGTPAAAQQNDTGLLGGTGAPSNSNGANGDFYFRADGGALTTIYQKQAGSWVGIV